MKKLVFQLSLRGVKGIIAWDDALQTNLGALKDPEATSKDLALLLVSSKSSFSVLCTFCLCRTAVPKQGAECEKSAVPAESKTVR